MKIPIFPGKYHQNGGFSMAMLVSGRVTDLVSSALPDFVGPLWVAMGKTFLPESIRWLVMCTLPPIAPWFSQTWVYLQ